RPGQFASKTISLGSSSTTTILNVSGSGVLSAIGCNTLPGSGPVADSTFSLEVAVDLGGFTTFVVLNGSSSLYSDVAPFATTYNSNGGLYQTFTLPFNMPYSSSLVVKGVNSASPGLGNITCNVIYSN